MTQEGQRSSENEELLDALYKQMDTLVHEMMRVGFPPEPGDSPNTVTDWVLVVGDQFYDGKDRSGAVSLFPRDGSAPAYITVGLLNEAVNKYR